MAIMQIQRAVNKKQQKEQAGANLRQRKQNRTDTRTGTDEPAKSERTVQA